MDPTWLQTYCVLSLQKDVLKNSRNGVRALQPCMPYKNANFQVQNQGHHIGAMDLALYNIVLLITT